MKKVLSVVLMVAMSLLLIGSVCFCIYSVNDLERLQQEMAKDPSVSGIDFLGLGWGYALILDAISFLGLIISIINTKVQEKPVLKIISDSASFVFVIIMVMSVCLFGR